MAIGVPNPLSLPDAVPFDGWAVDTTGRKLTLFWDHAYGTVRVYVAEQPDAVHLIATDTFSPPPDGVAYGWALIGHHESHVELATPLDGRHVVDATSGTARPQVPSGAAFEHRYEHRRSNPVDAPGEDASDRIWRYDNDGHTIRPMTPRRRIGRRTPTT